MDGERDATIGRDQCEQETSSAPCRCAAGTGTACSFTAPRHLPLDTPPPRQPSIIMMNWISLTPPLNSWSHSKATSARWLSFDTNQTQWRHVWASLDQMKQPKQKKTHGTLQRLSVGEILSISIFIYWMQRLVISEALCGRIQVLALWRGIPYNHIGLWKELVLCLEKYGSRCYKQITVADGWWTTFRWLQQSLCVQPHGILQHWNCEGFNLDPWEI